MEKSSSNKSTGKKRQSTPQATECQICGVPAIFSFYGVVSCNPCKMFFKRNAQLGQKAFKCNSDGHCEININNRHVCSSCRLRKCFTKGMQINMVRLPFSKRNRRKKKITEIVNPTETTCTVFSIVNILRSDQSTLTVEQWDLLSNLSHCYDEYSGLSLGERFMNEQNSLPPKIRFKSEVLIKYFSVSFEGTQLLYKNNQDFLSLSLDDRFTLLNSTMEHTASLSTNYIYHVIGLLSCPIYYDTVALITHPSVVPIAKRLAERIQFDIVVMKLFLAIVCFSTINYTTYSNGPPINLSNIKQVLNIQNKYIELTWTYLLYKYNYEQAVICFSDFIRCLFAVTESLHRTDFVKFIKDKITSLVEQTEQSFNLNN
ncbi:unnamed protein product [Rotaria sp. Silwood2]|nr:unnamed protein product [Rotaria sp. Silwood2]CAF4391251.1 unnamed protein product [Rotaria sp. Silwood2]